MKIKILKNFIGNVNGVSVPFHEGEEREVDPHAADHFIRGHYAEKLDKPAVKVITKKAGETMKVK